MWPHLEGSYVEGRIHKLIASIDDDPTVEAEEAWMREVDRRAEEVLRGEVELVPGDGVFRKAYARLWRK
jgi:hypothetical protein